MNIILWIIFGALAGWLASIIAGTNRGQGWLMNIVLGIAGAIVGGLLWQVISGNGLDTEFNIPSLIVAIVGALILTYAARFLSRTA